MINPPKIAQGVSCHPWWKQFMSLLTDSTLRSFKITLWVGPLRRFSLVGCTSRFHPGNEKFQPLEVWKSVTNGCTSHQAQASSLVFWLCFPTTKAQVISVGHRKKGTRTKPLPCAAKRLTPLAQPSPTKGSLNITAALHGSSCSSVMCHLALPATNDDDNNQKKNEAINQS